MNSLSLSTIHIRWVPLPKVSGNRAQRQSSLPVEATCGYGLIPHPFLLFRNGGPVLTREADTQGTPQLVDQILTHHEPTIPGYNEPQSLTPFAFSEPLSPMFFQPSNQAATGDIPANQPIPSSAHLDSSTTSNISTDVPAMNGVVPASTTAPPVPTTNVTTQHRFGCPLCPKTFDRLTRAEACHNEHLDLKPHVCHGACGDVAW